MKGFLVALAAAAALLGGAGAATLAIEHRLAALAPGGVEIARLHYNPLSGRLTLVGVRARDAAGRERFSADGVEATARPLALLARSLSLARVRVTAPRLTLRTSDALLTDLPLRIEDLAVTGGSVVVEEAGEGGTPVRADDLHVRLSRLTTAATDQSDIAFAVEMAMYGTLVHVTGQPRGAGYAVHVRAHGLDVPALARDVPGRGLDGLEEGRGEVDAVVVLAGGRLLASGYARLADVVLALPVPGRPRLRAKAVSVVADGFDLASGAGRLSRVELTAPSLSLPLATAAPTLAALHARLRMPSELLLRRVAVAGGTLALAGHGGTRLRHIEVAARAPERHGAGAWIVSARAALDSGAAVALDGRLSRDLRALDAAARVHRVALAPWRALAGAPSDWDARVSFEGRLRVSAGEDEPAVTLTGQAVLADVSTAGGDGFRAERIALGIRRLQWPAADAVVDTVVMTRPAFALPVVTPWPGLLVTGNLSVVDGEVRERQDRRALHDLEVRLAPDGGGAAHLRLSASADGGRLVGVDRLVPYEAAGEAGVPLRLLLAALEEAAAAFATAAPAALPAAAVAP